MGMIGISDIDTANAYLLKSGEPGILLKGLRYREELNQIEFAKKLNISQTNLSAMENWRRAIGKELAKRIADLWGLDYRIFCRTRLAFEQKSSCI